MKQATKIKPKVSATHKKRSGQHHRQSKHYLKAYWPYIPMLAIVGLGLVVNSIWTASAVLGATSDFSDSSFLASTNLARTADHESQLTIDPLLTSAAQAKAEDMVSHDYWSHTSPLGKTPWTFIAASGYSYQRAGENLAYGFNGADQTIDGWMNSPEHRANILNTSYQNVGFGVANSAHYQGHGPQTIVVAMYGQPAGDTAASISFRVPPSQTASSTSQGSQGGPNGVLGAHQETNSRLVSRVQLLTKGHAPWSLLAISILMGLAILIFIVHHGVRLHRLITRGELFFFHHPVFDIVVVLIATLGFVLTRTSGLIR
ncbi:MAG: CAP domain-containing protein [Candidatus Saccharibacteria bacterium]